MIDNLGSAEPTRLADAALLYAPSVARILKDLVDRKLVVRMPHPIDLRSSVISLSPTGRTLVSETARHTVQMLNTYAERFGGKRLDRLLEELQALTEMIAPLTDPGDPGGEE